MERDNQKEKIISIEQAKCLIRKAWGKATASGKRHVWIGDEIEEYRDGYLIPTITLEKGIERPNSYLRAWVDYTTGEVFIRPIGFGL